MYSTFVEKVSQPFGNVNTNCLLQEDKMFLALNKGKFHAASTIQSNFRRCGIM
jgi:hypothetical protein